MTNKMRNFVNDVAALCVKYRVNLMACGCCGSTRIRVPEFTELDQP